MKITEYTGTKFLQTLGKHYKEYNIEGYSDIYRAKIRHDINVGDIFNIYRANSRKEGCLWVGDLESSLINHLYYERSVL